MSHDTEALVATLQLLLSDLDEDAVAKILREAFLGKLFILSPRFQRAIENEIEGLVITVKRAVDMVTEPPLGRLACIQVQQDLTAAHFHVKKIEGFLGNPKR